MMKTVTEQQTKIDGDILNQQRLDILTQILKKHTGIDMTQDLQKHLAGYLAKAYRRYKYDNPDEFVLELQNKAINSPEIEDLIVAMVTHQGYFFHQRTQFEFLRDYWLPQIVKIKHSTKRKVLRIWNAGCGGGHETYSLAILLQNHLPDFDQWIIHLLGTDINVQALIEAERGIFREQAFNYSKNTKQRYFTETENGYLVNDHLKIVPSFFYHNLISDNYPSILNNTDNLDLIVCGNAFHYFDQSTVQKVMNNFAQCLVEGGHLLLGDYHASSQWSLEMERIKYHRVPCYRRPYVIKQQHETDNIEIDLALLHRLLNEQQWQAALNAVDYCLAEQGKSALLLQHKARILANLGDLQQADKLCDESIHLNKADPHVYLVKALILLELKQEDRAEATLKKALTINDSFVEIHYYYGMLLLRKKHYEQGFEQLKIALRQARKTEPNRKVHYAPRITFARFVEIIKREIYIYQRICASSTE